MPRLVLMRALRRFEGPGGRVRPGVLFRTVARRAYHLSVGERPFAEELFAASWRLRLEPEEYLERYPQGEHAALARRLTGSR